MSGQQINGKVKIDNYGNKILVDPYYEFPLAKIEETPYGLRLKPLSH
jgi:hypothetical protein